MTDYCIDCSATLEVPADALNGELISCPDCGLDYVVEEENGKKALKQLTVEGEDWGE